MGGAVGAEHARKVLKVMDLAAKTGAPVVALFDSMGVRLKEGVDAVNAYASIAAKTAQLSGVVPQIAVVLGQCAASAAMVAVQNDLVIVGENGRMFMNGPQVVSANTPDKVDAKSLGGAQACLKNGLAQLACGSDEEAIAMARALVCMLPSNNLEDAPVDLTQPDDVNRLIPQLDQIDTVTDVKTVLADIADNGKVLELGAACAPEMVVALAAIGGRTVGFVATQPNVGEGALTAEGCHKAARFVRLMDCYNVPVITLCDSVGISVAGAAGQCQLARGCAQLSAALAEASVPASPW